jgi:hypothetical protein
MRLVRKEPRHRVYTARTNRSRPSSPNSKSISAGSRWNAAVLSAVAGKVAVVGISALVGRVGASFGEVSAHLPHDDGHHGDAGDDEGGGSPEGLLTFAQEAQAA